MIDFGMILTYTMIWGGLSVGASILIAWAKIDKKPKSKAKVIK